MNSTSRRAAASVVARLALAIVGLACAAYVFREPILERIGAQLVRSDPLVRSDAIVVLAGGTPLRELEAVDLYLAGYAPRLALTVQPEEDGRVLLRKRGVVIESRIDLRKRIVTSLGLPESALTVLGEQRVDSTADEGRLVRDWLMRIKATRVIVVTSTFHTARSALVFKRLLNPHGIEVVMRPVAYDGFEPANWWRRRQNLRDGLFEWQKLVFYYFVY